mmetsp:Transcript_11829/g.13287  ORF Transcript_11829/g.13287 Transcript_11829/m.13287 type:complete len:124 (-) Transcript_11829:145-516(-)
MFRILLIIASLFQVALARADCNPASQVCDVDEIDEEMAAASQRGFAFIQAKSEMAAASQRGFAFIQAKSSRGTTKARKTAQIMDSLATHNAMVDEEVEKLAKRHGPRSVSHKRTMVHFNVQGK